MTESSETSQHLHTYEEDLLWRLANTDFGLACVTEVLKGDANKKVNPDHLAETLIKLAQAHGVSLVRTAQG